MSGETMPADHVAPPQWQLLLRETARLCSENTRAATAIVGGATAVALLQIAALSSLYPVFESLVQPASPPSALSAYFRNALEMTGQRPGLVTHVILFLIVSAATSGAYVGVMALQSRFIERLERSLRVDLMREVLRSGWEVLGRLNHGELVNVVTHDTEAYKVLVKNVFAMIAALLQIALFAAAITVIDVRFALSAVVALAAGYVVFTPLLRTGMRLGGRYTDAYAGLTSALINTARAFKNVKASSREAYLLAYLQPLLGAPGRVYRSQQMLEALRMRLFEFVGSAILLALLVFGIQVLRIALTEMLLLLVFLYRLVPRVTEAADFLHRAYVGLPALDKIQQLQRRSVAEPARDVELVDRVRTIAFERVGFHYAGVPVVTDVSVRFRQGEFWAISGPTGAGKTTVLDLTAGLLEPSSGEIHCDGHPLSRIARPSLHRRVGYVTQDSLIFAGSILENLRWGDDRVSREQLDAAIDMAELRDVIQEKTLDHRVTEAGHNLSGGQKQRIAIARVLAGNYDFILMDEPTSALDAETERRFIKALGVLKGRVGLIMVTHRPEYISSADYVLRLEHGTAVVTAPAAMRTQASPA